MSQPMDMQGILALALEISEWYFEGIAFASNQKLQDNKRNGIEKDSLRGITNARGYLESLF
jgi:hypothetical protein